MECKNKRRIKGFRKKKIWPSVLLFLVFFFICVSLIIVFISLFVACIGGMRFNQINEEAKHVGEYLETAMKDQDVIEAVEGLEDYLAGYSDLCITDKEQNIIRCFGESKPDFDTYGYFEVSDQYLVYGDEQDMESWQDGELVIPVKDVLLGAYGISDDVETIEIQADETDGNELEAHYVMEGDPHEEWGNRVLFKTSCWLEVPMEFQEYRVFYRGVITIVESDMIFICALGVVAIISMMIPMILLFGNVISTIITQRQMTRVLYLDATTGGNNWLYFVNKAHNIIKKRRNANRIYALVNLHLDKYQDYCTCYGGENGEEILAKINDCLKKEITNGETFARFATADFGLLIRCENKERCEERVGRIMEWLVTAAGLQRMSFHAGICLLDPVVEKEEGWLKSRKTADIDQLYHFANAARKTIGESDKKNIAFFDRKILEEHMWKHQVEERMDEALANKEFQVYIQPKYSPVNDRLVGAEALIRWITKEGEVIPPYRFIPIFEENGTITKIDDYMLSEVSKLQATWKKEGKKTVPVSVNVSRVHFMRDDLAEHIRDIVDDAGAEHDLIELEVTESAFFDDKNVLQNTLHKLKEYGFHISMDDFGAGYSSLNSLKDLPIDIVKLDMEFFRGEDLEKKGEIVVKETIHLAKELNMRIVAEGIEKREQVDFLAGEECDMIQGYFYAKPMPVAEFEKRVESDS